MLLLTAAVEAVFAVAPALTKRMVLLHRRLADISDCFQLKFFENIEIGVPAASSQPVETEAASVVASLAADCLPLRFASVAAVAGPCSYFGLTLVAASLGSLIVVVETLEVASCFLFVVVA